MVVDSFSLYTYLQGEKIESQHHSLLLHEIQKLHSHGYLHGDFHDCNFLVTKDGIAFIDTSFKPILFSSLSKCVEMIYFSFSLELSNPLRQVHDRYIFENFTPLCRKIAVLYFNWLNHWRCFKRGLRRAR